MNVTLEATLTAGPATVQDQSFPSGSTSWPLNLNPSPKQANVDTGVQVYLVNSPSSYMALGAVGSAGPVTQATLLVLRCTVPMLVRLTFHPQAGDFTSIIPLNGLLTVEADLAQTITQVEIQGGGTVELYASGLQ